MFDTAFVIALALSFLMKDVAAVTLSAANGGAVLGHIMPNLSPASLQAVVNCPVTILFEFQTSCEDAAFVAGLSLRTLQAFNPTVDCSVQIPPASFLCIELAPKTVPNINCLSSYSTFSDDSCQEISTAFDVSLSELTFMNPNLDCGKPFSAGSETCVVGIPDSNSVAIGGIPTTRVSSPAESCTFLVNITSDMKSPCMHLSSFYNISVSQISRLNRNLDCWNIKIGSTVCVSEVVGGLSGGSGGWSGVVVGQSSVPPTSTVSSISTVIAESPLASSINSNQSPDGNENPIPEQSQQPPTQPPESPQQPSQPPPPQPSTSRLPDPITMPHHETGASFIVSWNWFTTSTTDCDPSITFSEYNSGYYAGSEGVPLTCGQKGTFTYNGRSVTVTYMWRTTGGNGYHELTAQAFADLIGSDAKVGGFSGPGAFQAGINDPGRVTASCIGVC